MGESLEQISFVRPPSLPGIEILRAENTLRHFRAYHTAYTVGTGSFVAPAGQGHHYYKGDDVLDSPDVAFLMEPGEVLDIRRLTSPISFRLLFIPVETMSDLAVETGFPAAPPRWRCPIIHDDGLTRAFKRFHQNLEGAGSEGKIRDHLMDCVAQLLRVAAQWDPSTVPADRTSSSVALAVSRLQEHWLVNVPLEELAEKTGLSRFHFLRLFAKEKGMTPHAYQLLLRVARAREMLAKGASPSSVAAATGFADQSHMTRQFKKQLGVTPSRYAGSRR